MAPVRDDPGRTGVPETTGGGVIDPDTGHPYHRRMTERKIDQIADSAVLKVLQYAVTALLIPGMMWFGNRVLSDIDAMKTAVNVSTIQAATFELRVQALEKGGIERQAAIRLLTEQSLKHDYELRRLEDRLSSQNGSPPAR